MRVILLAKTELTNDIPGYVFTEDDAFSTEDPDILAEQAGRLCYESWSRPNPATATNEGYLANIIEQGHYSVLEHASATFYIDGVSRTFTHELVRHRHLSFSEVSQRYVNVEAYPIVVPPALRDNDDGDANTVRDMDEVLDFGREVYANTVLDLVDKGLPRKQARQAARAVLPAGLETKIVVSGNLRAWREVLYKRLSPAADAEFRLVARAVARKLIHLAPNTFQDISLAYSDFLEEN